MLAAFVRWLLAFPRRFFGSANDRFLKGLQPLIAEINAQEAALEKLDDEALRDRTRQFRERLAAGESLDDILVEAFATVREGAKRVFGQRHFDVQLMGGIVLHRGMIAEMKTGEGKTLVSTLPVYLNALTGEGVHVVTVNDYLARRDAEWMGRLYRFLGLEVGTILNGLDDAERRAAYAADITYATNNELGFDYLRDNMKYRLEDMVQRPFSYAVIDEVDSVLIDEARTPLIISGPTEDNSELYKKVDALIPVLEAGDFEKDEKQRSVTLTEAGVERIENLLMEAGLLSHGGLYDLHNVSLVHHVNQALRAHKSFQRDVDYIVKDDKVIIIDEFTGRMMDGRRYSEGLHQALEAKEHVTIQNENQTLASITFQNYFRLYPKLSGMTGTAMTEAGEFADIYKLEVIEVPTNVPVSRIDYDDEVYRTEREKFAAIKNQIDQCFRRKKPILVGTVSIEKSEALSEYLKQANIPHQVLNARYHEQEASIIAQAGRPGAVTIATNMAGRGTDIQLGGNLDLRLKTELAEIADPASREIRAAAIRAEIEAARKIVLRDELRVRDIVTATEDEAKKVIAQLRKGVDFVTLADTHSLDREHPGGDLGYVTRDELPSEIAAVAFALQIGSYATIPVRGAAGWHVIKVEDRSAGGLYVIGSERHESRRIDNQLRGRSGRQGDPGASKFFISLQDDLMRIFGSDRMDSVVQSLGIREGEAMVHSWMNKALEKAQQKVEARNYEQRKLVLKYDDVMNDQRKVIYEQRRDIMNADEVSHIVADMRVECLERLVSRCVPANSYAEQWDSDGLNEELRRLLGIDFPIVEWAKEEGIIDDTVLERIVEAAAAKFAEKTASFGLENMQMIEKNLLLQILDQTWKEHLLALDHLRQGINLRAYGQRDPLNEYKREAFEMFEEMLVQLRENVTRVLMQIEMRIMPQEAPPAPPPAIPGGGSPFDGGSPFGGAGPFDGPKEIIPGPLPVLATAAAEQGMASVSRNAACPCGSGKKFKHCHGRI